MLYLGGKESVNTIGVSIRGVWLFTTVSGSTCWVTDGFEDFRLFENSRSRGQVLCKGCQPPVSIVINDPHTLGISPLIHSAGHLTPRTVRFYFESPSLI